MTELHDPGPRPELLWIPVADIIVDHNYQRDLIPIHVQRIFRNFSWLYFQVVTVVREGKKYIAIDGQHRWAAARCHPKIDEVPCVVLAAMPTEEQARAFVTMNQGRKNISSYDLFYAELAAGDENARQLQEMLDRHGITALWYQPKSLPPKKTGALSTMRKLIRRGYASTLEITLAGIPDSWPLSAKIIESLEATVRAEGWSKDELARRLREWRPGQLLGEASARAHERGTRVAPEIHQLLLGK